MTFFDVTVFGVFRSFSWNSSLAVQLACWFLTFLWLQELVYALGSFVLSYTAMNWYFAPSSSSRTSWMVLLQGIAIGCLFHLGSLAFGAFVLAWMRSLQSFLVFLVWLLGDLAE